MISRRAFIGGGLAAVAVARQAVARVSIFPFGPACFDVTATSALIWCRTDGPAPVHVAYGTTATNLDQLSAPTAATESTDFTAVVELTGLRPATGYFYRALTPDGAGTVLGFFRTAPADARELRLAWSGDMEAGHRPFSLLDHVTALRPDLFLMVGDTTYADVPKEHFKPTLVHYRLKHRENRVDAPLQRLLRQTAVTAIWDDHEVENDFDGTHPALGEGRQAFREYWPVRSPDLLYRHLAWGPLLEVFVLDCRSYRSPPGETAPGRSMLGAAQKAWLTTGLAASTATFKVIVSSVPFLGSSRQDSWHGYAVERQEIQAALKRANVRNVIVLSADIHMALDFESDGLQQLVAGPIGAWPHCSGRHADARRKELRKAGRPFLCDGMNFGALTLRPGARPEAEVTFFDDTAQVRHRRVFAAS
jgi:alkaline phosphatase D